MDNEGSILFEMEEDAEVGERREELEDSSEEQEVPSALREGLVQLEARKDQQEHLRADEELGRHVVGEEAAAVDGADQPVVIQHAEHDDHLQQRQMAFLERLA
eukprot:scaffold3350_cov268-Pinguiococcus_pyrenoidosus.AAC.14